jgi:hypothetical protein
MIFLGLGVFILSGGEINKMVENLSEGKALFMKFVHWNFPRFASASSDSGEL